MSDRACKILPHNREELRHFIADNWLLALLIYAAVYVVAVALSFPAAGLLTVIGGLLFGWLVGAIATIFAATAGATIIFLAARTSLEKALARKAGRPAEQDKRGLCPGCLQLFVVLAAGACFPSGWSTLLRRLPTPAQDICVCNVSWNNSGNDSLKLRRCRPRQRHRCAKSCP